MDFSWADSLAGFIVGALVMGYWLIKREGYKKFL